MKWNQKIYLVTRRDLSPGSQAVQAVHALREFIHLHPKIERKWYKKSNHVCFLSVENERALVRLSDEATMKGIKWASFQEPDLNDQTTAICLEPTEEARELCAILPLALVEYIEEK